MSSDTYRLQLNNLVQHLRMSWEPKYTTTGPQHNEVHTCKILVNSIQYGNTKEGRTKKEALEAAARSAYADLLAQHMRSNAHV